MPRYYTYLISSLPMLHFGMKLPFSFERFLEACQGFISEEEIDMLKTVYAGYIYEGSQPTLKKWFAFDTALRNELVKIRALRKRIDPLKYVRKDGFVEPFIAHVAMNAYRNPSVLEAERLLDLERWRLLEELAVGHYFDIDALIIYALKLLILERWERVRAADKSRLLEETLKTVSN